MNLCKMIRFSSDKKLKTKKSNAVSYERFFVHKDGGIEQKEMSNLKDGVLVEQWFTDAAGNKNHTVRSVVRE